MDPGAQSKKYQLKILQVSFHSNNRLTKEPCILSMPSCYSVQFCSISHKQKQLFPNSHEQIKQNSLEDSGILFKEHQDHVKIRQSTDKQRSQIQLFDFSSIRILLKENIIYYITNHFNQTKNNHIWILLINFIFQYYYNALKPVVQLVIATII
ncbi:unnamed protein product [Paramecium octaurelia]|uniref:Uncharacterized protein n=1 Tax=Paramecium octaurelia TaxID=43137 RepID=A0A8S1VCP2_PAROT|nr:unnamed protein product [Paramecium octaurelia]